MSGYNLFSDPTIDSRIVQELPSQYWETLRARSLRYQEAYTAWMTGYEAEAKPLLILLQAKINFYNGVLQNNPTDAKAIAELAAINNLISNNDYAVENTADYDYAVSRKQRIAEFRASYPDSSELNQRQVEENTLLSQLL